MEVQDRKIRVGFENFLPQWDEIFDIDSNNISEFATRSEALNHQVYQIPLVFRNAETSMIFGYPIIMEIGAWYSYDEFEKVLDAFLMKFSITSKYEIRI
jgi:hypothetical protein